MNRIGGKAVPRRPGISGLRRRALVVLGAGSLVVTLLATLGRPPGATSSQEVSAHAEEPAKAPEPAPAGPAAFRAREAAATKARDLEVRPMFDRTTRLEAGKPAKIRFAARAARSASPASTPDLSVSVFHPGEPEHRLPAHEVEEGVYEATFTPHGVGGYRVTLLSGGIPISSVPPVRLGVVGAVGAPDPTVTDITDTTGYDPLTTRSKVTGRGRRR